jgi:hypothetical protein
MIGNTLPGVGALSFYEKVLARLLLLVAIMSLSALLLGGEPPVKASKKRKQKEQEPAVSIDDGLDALFKSSVRVYGPGPACDA